MVGGGIKLVGAFFLATFLVVAMFWLYAVSSEVDR